jgi:hypothetical protein
MAACGPSVDPQQERIDKCVEYMTKYYVKSLLYDWQISSTKIREGCTWRVEEAGSMESPWLFDQDIEDWR